MRTESRTLLIGAFLLSSSLITCLAYRNCGAANDDHLEVCDLINEDIKIESAKSCWQCYHPKIYHNLVVATWKLFKLKDQRVKIQFAQMINAFFGICTLCYCLLFIKGLYFQDNVSIISFSLIAFNPRLIAIFSQPTNDALIIFFGTLMLYYLHKYINYLKWTSLVIILSISALSIHIKYNGIILILGILFVLLLKLYYYHKTKNKFFNKALIGFICYLLVNSYSLFNTSIFKKYIDKKDVTEIYNSQIYELPKVFEKTAFKRPGVRSISEAYFSFNIVSLIDHPQISNHHSEFRKHRTSLWSQLYGRMHFLYFDYWPYCWQNKGSRMLAAGRVSLSLALIPTLIFLLSIIFRLYKKWTKILKEHIEYIRYDRFWFFDIFILGFCSFIILFTLKGRDFSFMKVIYLYPGIIATIPTFMIGLNLVNKYLTKKPILKHQYYASYCMLFVYYLIPIFNLIIRMPYCPN